MAARLQCAECQCWSDPEAAGWRAYLIDVDEDGQDEAVFFCPDCVAQEFRPLGDAHGMGD